MTIAQKHTKAYSVTHERLRSEVVPSPQERPDDLTAGQQVFDLLSASMAVCALPSALFTPDDIQDIRNVRTNLARLIERLS